MPNEITISDVSNPTSTGDVLLSADHDPVTRNAPEGTLALGQWYWVKDEDADWDKEEWGAKKGQPYEWFGCVMEIGSNYVEIKTPINSMARIHFDDFWRCVRREFNPEAVIADKQARYQGESRQILAKIQDLAQRLGVAPSIALAAPSSNDGTGTALAVLSGQTDLRAHQAALVRAKEKDLPALYKALEESNERLTKWAKASLLSLQATITPMQQTVDAITDRLFTFGLYAGFGEEAIQCCEGKPAAAGEKLHVMQRRLYMDEEALLDYQAGGMDFKNLLEFDAWLCQPQNRDRILPFPRTLVAMRVRRHTKFRETHGNLLEAFVKIREEDADKWTFLYIRNGDQVWRLASDMDFGAMIFPDEALVSETEPMMMRVYIDRIDRMITLAEYEEYMRVFRHQKALSDDWRRANPDTDTMHDPHMGRWIEKVDIPGFGSFRPNEWEPLNRDSVYYDQGMARIANKIKEYNRIAVIIQGLFDRSPILHPHPPVQMWTAAGFASAVKLVYDADRALTYGQAPDFEAYRARVNASLSVGSVVVGQEHVWMVLEAQKENARRDRDYRDRSSYRYEVYKPDGDPGPGLVAIIQNWKPRSKLATFAWEKNAARDYWGYKPKVRKTVTVPAADLLNIDAYRPGDFKQFFADPRTRAEYLRWAPLLLTAEDYHAGKIQSY